MKFVIVKHAGTYWNLYWRYDPKSTGVDKSQSASSSFTGMGEGLLASYDSKRQAEEDCIRINKHNPSGDYAVCSVID